jgi:ubiquinone/menaquinone biosynthesis C-methylase UbiE
MNTETLARSKFGMLFARIMARAMESRFRYRFFEPNKTLAGVDCFQGRDVLEIGCGTGFFTIPIARLIGDKGSLVSLDILQESVELVSDKVRLAGLTNVSVLKGDAQDTGLASDRFNIVVLFGIVPAPMIHLRKLLDEIHRLLKPGGILAVWPPVPGLMTSIGETELFAYKFKRNRVLNFEKS